MSTVELFGAFAMPIEHQVFFRGGESIQNMIVFGEFQNFVGCVSLPPFIRSLLRRVNPRKNHPRRTLVGEWRQQHIVNHAENGGGGANSQCQRGDRDCRKSAGFPECTQRVPQVVPHFLNQGKPLQISAVFLLQGGVAKLPPRCFRSRLP